LLGDEAPAGLSQAERASVVVAVLAYRSPELDLPAGASGFLVPRSGRLMTACSFASSKWPHWSSPGTTLLRVSAGRDGDDRALALTDHALAERLAGEVCAALRTSNLPFAWRVARWPGAFPQYRVGHLERVDGWEASLRRCCPRVVLAGASYRGSGLPACIQSGQRAAATLMSRTAAVART
jgi:oxygen-dependent protoporphyrinogen oxidase